ncbi:MAG: IS256 family transposase [Verrucomicrobia bacterium]|nr:IS256 family transposase [Verrucomicrobiota bacterium]
MPKHNPPQEILHEEDRFTTVICQSELESTLRAGACRLLVATLEAEVERYLARHQGRDDEGHRLVVRNGHGAPRELQTGLGRLELRAPRVDDRRENQRFSSQILPPYLRRVPSLENLIPVLYLKGISTSAMPAALAPLLGPNAAGLAPTSIVRLIAGWQEEYQAWMKRDLSGEEIVYLWADGIYCNVRLTDERPCLLVVIGARKDGTKVLLAICDGERESELSWLGVLQDLRRRGIKLPPKLAVADGALGFWPALEKVWPSCQAQRCWVHKMNNVLDKLPKKLQPEAKERMHDIWMADTRKEAEIAFDRFIELYQSKHDKSCACLKRDRTELLAFYDFPAEHWRHLRTTNPIESSFATIRHRADQTKGGGSRLATLALMFQLGRECEKSWRHLNGSELIQRLIAGVRFIDGIAEKAA